MMAKSPKVAAKKSGNGGHFWRGADKVIRNTGESVASIASNSGVDAASIRRMIKAEHASRRDTIVRVINYLNKAYSLKLDPDVEITSK